MVLLLAWSNLISLITGVVPIVAISPRPERSLRDCLRYAACRTGDHTASGTIFGSDVSNLRKEAAAALGEIADPRTLAVLEASAGDPDPDMRKLVRWATDRCRASA